MDDVKKWLRENATTKRWVLVAIPVAIIAAYLVGYIIGRIH